MPHADLLTTLLPALLVLIGALAALGAEPFLSRADKHSWLPWIAAIALVAAGAALPFVATGHLHGILVMDPARVWLCGAVIAATLIAIAGLQQSLSRDGFPGGEPYPLMLFAAVGVLIMVMASDLIAVFVGLETASLAIYALVGLRRHRKESNEALFKYLIMGAVFSALFLYGAALHYGATGSTHYVAAILPGREQLATMSLVFLTIGLLFKVGAVPFHFWSPDAYTGAPVAVTGFMGAVIKVGGFVALGAIWLSVASGAAGAPLDLTRSVRIDGAHHATLEPFSFVFQMVAVLSIVLGNYAALKQTSLRRMLAFSSVAHAGYLLLGFLLPGPGGVIDLVPVWLYLIGYAVATAGTLTAIAMLAGKDDAHDTLHGVAGQARVQPLPGIVLTVLIASMAGLPPTIGFLGKFAVLGNAVSNGYLAIAIIAVIMAVVGAAYYLRFIVAIWGSAPKATTATGSSTLSDWTLVGSALAVVLLLAAPGAMMPGAAAAPTVTTLK